MVGAGAIRFFPRDGGSKDSR